MGGGRYGILPQRSRRNRHGAVGKAKVKTMSWRRLGALFVVLAVLGSAGQHPHAATASDPAAFIDNLANQTIKILKQHLPDAERERLFKTILDDNFDMPRIARFVLGRYWNGASDQEKRDFQPLLEDYLVRSYSNRFSRYSGETVKVGKVEAAGENTFVVFSQLIDPAGAPPVDVQWRVIRNGNDYRISDVSVAGVSLALTHREEFAAVIERQGGGVATLNRMLRERLAATATTEK